MGSADLWPFERFEKVGYNVKHTLPALGGN